MTTRMPEARRRYPRISYCAPVELVELRAEGAAPILARADNLSEGGMFLHAPGFVRAGTDVVCAIPLDGQRRELRARVAWERPDDRRGGSSIGIEFVDVTTDASAALRSLIAGDVLPLGTSRAWFDGVRHAVVVRPHPTGRGAVIRASLPFLTPGARVRLEAGERGARPTLTTIQSSALVTDPHDGTPHLRIELAVDAHDAVPPTFVRRHAPDAVGASADAGPQVAVPDGAVPRPRARPRVLHSVIVGALVGSGAWLATSTTEDLPSAPVTAADPGPVAPRRMPAPTLPRRASPGAAALPTADPETRSADLAGSRPARDERSPSIARADTGRPPTAPSPRPTTVASQELPRVTEPIREPVRDAVSEPVREASRPTAPSSLGVPGAVPATARASDATPGPRVSFGDVTQIVVPISGSVADARHYPLDDPPGVAINVPRARAGVPLGDLELRRGGVRDVLVAERRGGIQIRVHFTTRTRPPYEVVVGTDRITVIVGDPATSP